MRAFNLLILPVVLLLSSQAIAQTAYPDRPIKMIVPLAAASAVDVAARIVTQKMADNMGQQFVILNLPGASGLIGAEQVARAEPDGYLYRVLNNPVVVGDAVHKGVAYPGEHPPIIDRKLWGRVRSVMQASPRVRGNRTRARTPALLKGLIFGPTGLAMTPTHTRRQGRLYRYYVSTSVLKQGPETCPIGRIGAADDEGAVVEQVRTLLVCPEVIVKTWRELRKSIKDLSEAAVRDAFSSFGDLWDDLFPAEQARIVQLLVERVDIKPDSLSIRLRAEGLTSLLTSLRAPSGTHAA